MRNFIALCKGKALDEPSLLPPGTRLGPYFGIGLDEGRAHLRGRRIHYRIVLKEDCIPSRRVKSLETVFNALADISRGICLPVSFRCIVGAHPQSSEFYTSTAGCIVTSAMAIFSWMLKAARV